MSNLVLITSEFPYYSGETFLINELPYLSKWFGKIYIFSINGRIKDYPTRSIPGNTRCFPLNGAVSNAKYVKYTVAGMRRPDGDLCIREKSLKRIVSCLYSRGRAGAVASQIYSVIEKERLELDNTIIYSFWFSYQAIAAWLLSKKLNSNGLRTFAISRAHGYDLYWGRVPGRFQPFQDVSLKNLKWCFPCSEFGTNYLLNKYPWAVNSVQTRKLGTNDFGLNPYKYEMTLVTCCNLEPLKRMSIFAEAFCEIAKENKKAKWICIGSGVEENKISEIVSSAGVTDQVHMMGRISNEEVMRVYQQEGVMYFCNISTMEGLPVSIMEAMSFGIPIIATDAGGTSELVDETNGQLIPCEIEKNQLIGYIKNMLNIRKERYNSMRLSSRSKWEQNVSAERNYSSFCNFLISESELYFR